MCSSNGSSSTIQWPALTKLGEGLACAGDIQAIAVFREALTIAPSITKEYLINQVMVLSTLIEWPPDNIEEHANRTSRHDLEKIIELVETLIKIGYFAEAQEFAPHIENSKQRALALGKLALALAIAGREQEASAVFEFNQGDR